MRFLTTVFHETCALICDARVSLKHFLQLVVAQGFLFGVRLDAEE